MHTQRVVEKLVFGDVVYVLLSLKVFRKVTGVPCQWFLCVDSLIGEIK